MCTCFFSDTNEVDGKETDEDIPILAPPKVCLFCYLLEYKTIFRSETGILILAAFKRIQSSQFSIFHQNSNFMTEDRSFKLTLHLAEFSGRNQDFVTMLQRCRWA